MFGHQDEDQVNQDNSQVNDQAGSNISTPTNQPTEPFNPAMPSPATSFGETTVSDPTTDDNDATIPQISQPLDTPLDQTAPVNDLLDIKQKALGQLSPLVGHLDQTPEEKFRTTMMMIQATDNQDLIKDAYAAAQTITDEKAKAQALLDIVNEINYFTSQHKD